MKRILIMILVLMMIPFVSSFEDITGEYTKKDFDKSAIDTDKSSYCGKESIMKEQYMHYKHMGGGKTMYKANWILIKVISFALAAFIFSIIFWATHNWLVKKKKR